MKLKTKAAVVPKKLPTHQPIALVTVEAKVMRISDVMNCRGFN